MSLVVDLQLSGDPIEITDVPAAVPDATFEIQNWRQGQDFVIWYLWVEGPDLDRVTAAFESLSNAEDVGVLNATETAHLYRIRQVPHVGPMPMDLLERGTITGGSITPDGLNVTSRVSGRDVLTGALQFLRGVDIDISVKRLRRASADSDGGRMTDPQFQALVTAFEMGYFEQPKEATHEEVAAELGIARSSLSERLRRAESELIREKLGR